MYSQEVIKLTPQTVEALKKLGEKECPECKGSGMIHNLFLYGKVGCHICNVTGKVGGRKWEPKVGQWCIDRHKIVRLIINVLKDKLVVEPRTTYMLNSKDVTPILPWETIEEILEKAGYMTRMDEETWAPDKQFKIWDTHKKGYDEWSYPDVEEKAKTRQLAVMKAVIELDKEK